MKPRIRIRLQPYGDSCFYEVRDREPFYCIITMYNLQSAFDMAHAFASLP